jgi:long-chain acyl-CoA synthetase
MVLEDFLATLQKIDIIPRKKIENDLPFYMGFTSGTTGEPKAFIRSQQSWLASFQANIVDFQMNEQEQVLIPGALIHSHFLYGAISTLFLGGTVFLLEKFTPQQALSTIETHSMTTVFVVPTMIQAFIKENRRVTKPIKLISSGAKWEEHSKKQIQQLFPQLTRYEFYGASELSFVTVLAQYEHHLKPGSVGKACFGVELQIRRENQELANPLEIGKIFIRSNMLFNGYLRESSTFIHSIADRDGWVTVDDMGYIDNDGYLYLVGREKNMILYGGINLFPEEIEKVISAHAKVKEVAVIGIKDEYWGQIACAVIIGNITKKELIQFCKHSLASYKIPRKWFFVDEMPYTISGKIARATLKEQLESKVMYHE